MKEPRKFAKPCGVLNIGMLSIITLYIGMGFFGYIRYGNSVEGSITFSISEGTDNIIPAKIAQILLAISIFFTHALQCYVAIDISWNDYIFPRIEKGKRTIIWEYVLRTSIVLVTCEYPPVFLQWFLQKSYNVPRLFLPWSYISHRLLPKLFLLRSLHSPPRSYIVPTLVPTPFLH